MPLREDEIQEVIGLIKQELLAAGLVKVQPPQVTPDPLPTPEPVVEPEPEPDEG